jgi:hypothetical protein
VRDHAGAATDRALRDRPGRCLRERSVDVFRGDVHAGDVVQDAVVGLADHREMPCADALRVLGGDDRVPDDADREGVRQADRRRQQAGLPHPLEPRELAVAVQAVRPGEGGQLGRDDHGHPGADVFALDDRRVPDAGARDVGDRVQRTGLEVADPDPEVPRPGHQPTAVSCETRFSFSISRAITSRWISFVPS